MSGTFAPDADLALALRLADAARAVSLARFRGDLQRRTKPDGSLVTDADEAVEDTLRAMLLEARPSDAVLGEERGQTGAGARRWILDGIDGTVSFAAGSDQWATLIALEVEDRVVVGVCDQPALDRRSWAMRGGGAFRSVAGAAPARLNVSSMQELASARALIAAPEWQRTERARAQARALANATTPAASVDHPALEVARGDGDVAVFFVAGAWDLAAPSIVVEEAGGRFTDLDGRHRLTSGNAVFSNGLVHEAVLRVLSDLPAG